MIYRLAALVALGAAIAFAMAFYLSRAEVGALRVESAELRADLAACGGRLGDIIEDRRSDATVDDLTDDDLRRVPPGWLRP